jgi:sec-independent protein translocase protein TatA
MMNVGPLELIIVLVIALVVLGPKRLPEAGKSLGKGMREFRDALSGGGSDDDDAQSRAERHPPGDAESVSSSRADTEP